MTRRARQIQSPTYGDLRNASPTAIAPDEWCPSGYGGNLVRRVPAKHSWRIVRDRLSHWDTMTIRPTLTPVSPAEILHEATGMYDPRETWEDER
jgi:hypothetical protein